jgi:hypothetical protein
VAGNLVAGLRDLTVWRANVCIYSTTYLYLKGSWVGGIGPSWRHAWPAGPAGHKIIGSPEGAGEAVRLPESDGVYHLCCLVVNPSLNYEANTIYDRFSVSSATRQECPGHNQPSCLWMPCLYPAK